MRRGQLLSIDALLSLVVMAFLLASLINVSSNLRGEVVSAVNWFSRSNIAENMADVLLESPGEPENWNENVNSTNVVGLVSSPGIVDYEKLKTLVKNINNPRILSSLYNLSLKKDFLIEFYLSLVNVSVYGQFPKVYIDNMTFSNPSGKPPGVEFTISSKGNRAFEVTYLELVREGVKYINEEVLDLTTGANLNLEDGDRLKFILAEDVTLTVKRASGGGTVFQKQIPAGAVVEILVTGPEVSNFKLTFQGSWNVFKFTGQGNVVVTVSSYSNTTPEIVANKTFYTTLLTLGTPTYWFAVINGSLVTDKDTILSSMNRSEWIEPIYRIVTVERFEYNLSKGPSGEDPLIYGVLSQPLPSEAFLMVSAPNTPGNVTFVTVSGPKVRGVLVYREESNDILRAIIIEDNKTILYRGNTSSISIPLDKIFDSYENGIIGMWLYSTTWNRQNVNITIIPSIKWVIKPMKDLALVKLVVWDDS